MPEANPAGNVIVIDAYAIRHEARRKGWVPGVLEVEHDHLAYVGNWGDAMLNAAAAVWRFADVPVSSLPAQFFCRPAEDNKLWKAGPTRLGEFLEWHAQVRELWDDPEVESSIQPDTRIVIGQLREIAEEHRFWVVDGRVVTNSLYKRGERVTTRATAIRRSSRSRRALPLIPGSRNGPTPWTSAWGRPVTCT